MRPTRVRANLGSELTALRILVLGCSGASTGELTLTFDWLRRLRREVDVHVIVNALAQDSAKWFGATVHGYAPEGGREAVAQVEAVFDEVKPDVLLVADLLLAYLTSPEFARYFRRGPNLLAPFLERAARTCRVVALDLYDWDAHHAEVDLFGRPGQRFGVQVSERIRRLMPSPYLAPAPSTPGRGRYPLMKGQGAPSDAERRAVREELGLGERVVFIATSPWQHLMAGHREATQVSLHLPALLLDWLDEVRAAAPHTVLHLGPHSFGARDGYRHVPQMPPDQFRRLLGAADLVLSPNTIATTNIRAASFLVPVCAVHYSGAPITGASAAARFHEEASPYPWHVWPLGLYRLIEAVLANNPYRAMQTHLDVARPEEAVETMIQLLTNGAAIDAARAKQTAFFAELEATVDDAEGALDAVLAD